MNEIDVMKRFVVVFVVVLIAACSNKQVYTAIQQNQRFECSKLPQAQSEECLRQFESSYEQYEEDRQDIAKEQK